jgi:hypothetical protein
MPAESAYASYAQPNGPYYAVDTQNLRILTTGSMSVSAVLACTVSCMVIRFRPCASFMALNRTVPVRTNEQDNLTGTELREASAKHHRCRDVAMPVCSTNIAESILM